MYFEVVDSDYLNFSLSSSEPINLILQSIPEMVTLHIEAVTEAASTQILLTGFAPLTTYYKYEDDYHNEVEFQTDAAGGYSYTQDLSEPHVIFIQPSSSTFFIRDNSTGGDCMAIGVWDVAAKTCTLTQDVFETIQIDGDGITLDGEGFKVSGAGTGIGVLVSAQTQVTIRRLVVEGFTHGIDVRGATDCLVEDNTLRANVLQVHLSGGWQNVLQRNDSSSSLYRGTGFYLIRTRENAVRNNTANFNSRYGLYLIHGSDDNEVTGNSFNSNYTAGMSVWGSQRNRIIENQTNDCYHGMLIRTGSHHSTVVGNRVEKNSRGIVVENSSLNRLEGNAVTDSGNPGIGLWTNSHGNEVVDNVIKRNRYGLTIWGGNINNLVYNNNFIDNISFQAGAAPGNIFHLDPPVGGNYWSDWTSPDADGDGFVDVPYVFNSGQDDYPWACPFGDVDQTPPVSVLELAGTWGDNGWHVSDVVATLSASDSGGTCRGGGEVAFTEYSFDQIAWQVYTGPFTISDEGSLTLHYRSADTAGNVEATRSQTLHIDKTPPLISASHSPQPNAAGWNNCDVTVTFSCLDAVSGVGSCSPPHVVSSEGAGTTVFGNATDNAGNGAVLSVGDINIDKTPPAIQIDIPLDYGLYTLGMALDFSAQDSLSGVAGLLGRLANSQGEEQDVGPGDVPAPGVYTLEVEAGDVAGNFASGPAYHFVIYDPSGGFATGGGWFYPDGESSLPASGKAHFGFIAKYKQGSSIGNLEFQYQEGDINLKSATIDWLVISATSAQFQGTGTINGEGTYTFRVRGTDNGEPGAGTDHFDIRIWEGAETEGNPLHKAKNTLNGGNIVVRKR